MPRTSQAQFSAARKILLAQAAEGDLLFFKDQEKLSHVGIYLGDGKFVHAASSGDTVRVASIDAPYYQRHLVAVGRLPSGSGPGFRRPVLVVQSNPFNESRISTAVVAVITSNLALADAPGNVRAGKADSGLAKPSVVNVSQILTIDKALLTDRVRPLPAAVMVRGDDGLRLVLGL